MNKFIKNFFSITNQDCHKIITILGIKIKFKSTKLIMQKKFDKLDARITSLCNLYSKTKSQLKTFERCTHRHIDFVYRDLMVILENKLDFIGKHDITLKTNYPVAYESNDHLVPHGTVRDNTRFPRFITKCETLFPEKKQLSFLDLGCSGGGMVLDAILKNHFAIGLEGSNSSQIMQRAEWRLLQNNLFTCDITKPFDLLDKDNKNFKFDIISAWEVLEHLPENSLEQFFANLAKHMHQESLFIATIASWDDIDPITKVNWHVTVKPFEWWKNIFDKNKFIIVENLIDEADYPRAAYNPPNCYQDPNVLDDLQRATNFKIVLKKK